MQAFQEEFHQESLLYPELNTKVNVVNLTTPVLLYFTQGEKGPASRLHKNGKVVFPHRNSQVGVGFALIDTIYHHDKFAFIDGTNIQSYPLSEQTLRQIFFQTFGEGDGFYEAVTCDGIEGFIRKSHHGEHFCFIDEDFQLRTFSTESIISSRKDRFYQTVEPWTSGKQIFQTEWENLKKDFLLPDLNPIPYFFYAEDIGQFVVKNPLLQPFYSQLRNGQIAFVDPTSSLSTHQRESFKEGFRKKYLHKCPLTLTSLENYHETPVNRSILEHLHKYNKSVFRWWKQFGIYEFPETYRPAIEKEFSKTALYA